jgi:small subunit ribosomal protein S4
MARDLSPKYKRSRREGVELFPDLDKAGTDRSPLTRRRYKPGVHGPKGGWAKPTAYGAQLREKQKAKRLYGILERQFRNYYAKAMRSRGDTGETLLALLEKRLDNVVYRLGLAKTRQAARQMVTHGHIMLDGRRAAIPSLSVKIGHSVKVADRLSNRPQFIAASSAINRSAPAWLLRENYGGKVMAEPDLSDAKLMLDPRPIIEFYSR